MKNRILILVLLMLVSSFVFAENYRLVKHYQIGPGAYYSYYEVPSRPWTIHVTEIDLSNPFLKIETVKAKDKLYGFEGVSSMSKRNDTEGHRVVMATNGDFYNTSTGEPSNNQICNGEFVKGYSTWGTAFTYSEGGIPDFCIVQFSGKVISKNGSGHDVVYPLKAVNRPRSTNDLVIYNNFYGTNTGTSVGGFECLVSAMSDWLVNDTVVALIETCDSIANRSIPEGKFVLSGLGGAKEFLQQNCLPGDTIRIIQKIADSPKRLTQLIGGGAWFLKDGVDMISPDDVVRHPRTGIGFSADSTKLFLMVVDGRSTQSIGMDYHQMGDFLTFMGAAHGLNLDGGGSSTMVVRNSIVNTPSDGGERSVSNSVHCISSAPNGVFTHVQAARDSIAVYKNKSVDLEFSGWDEYYNPTGNLNWSQLIIHYDNRLGSFDSNIFTANDVNGDTYFKADYNGDSDSVLVHIIELNDLSVYPDTLTIDSVTSIEYVVSARNEAGSTQIYKNDLFEFTVLDPHIAEINEEGVIIGKENGETDVIVAYGEETDTVHVFIQIGSGESVVDEIESTEGWTMTADAYIDLTQTSIGLADRIAGTGTKALQLNYAHTGSEDGNIYLEMAPVDIYGVPEIMMVDILSDSVKHWVYIMLEDAEGKDYEVKTPSSLGYNDDYRTQFMLMSGMLPTDGAQMYPIKVKGIRFRIDDKATSGTLYVDRIRVSYPNWTSIEREERGEVPAHFSLKQNYPNPFNPETVIGYDLNSDGNVSVDVYNILGKHVRNLHSGYQTAGSYNLRFHAGDLPAGIYYYRLTNGSQIETKKMVLIK